MCISGIYAISDEISDIENGISTSSVDISIKEYNQNGELFQDDGKHLAPGDEIVLIPRVHNLGINCYIRAKINYTIDGDSFSENEFIKGNYSSWTKKGDYYYYDAVFGKNESIDLFNKVLIPNSLSSEYNGKKAIIRIVVDAVQVRNFDGNWDEVTIKKSIDRTYNIDYDGESSIVYEDDTNNHVSIDDGYFDKLGNILPGDSIRESITIKNHSSNKNRYFMSISYDNLKKSEIELLKMIKLSIKNSNNQVLVDSNLGDAVKQSLGDFNAGEGDTFVVELTFPESANNDYSRLFAKVIWNFSYEPLDGQAKADNLMPSQVKNPQTGDFNIDWSITIFLLSTLGFIITMVLDKMYKEKNEEVRNYNE